VPVIYHNATLYRVSGHRRRVADQSFAALRSLDWGGWFDSGFSGEPLMRFNDVLKRFSPHTRLMIEIKAFDRERRSGHAYRLTEKVIDMLDAPEQGLSADRIFILSFDPKVLSLAHRLAPQWHYVLNLPQKEPGSIMALPEFKWDHLWAIDGMIQRLSAPLVCWAHARGLKMFTYTCNTPRQIKKALALGVDAVISDKPAWLTHFLDIGSRRHPK
jgi:glycerophosphoryl diester phosphodiesterase